MPILSLLLLVFTTQVLCSPRESTATCGCKQGVASACEALRQTDAALADALEAAATQTLKVQEEATAGEGVESAQTEDAAEVDEPPQCTGQMHHIISRTIAKALKKHPVLRNLYQPRDLRFVAQAKDQDAHCGYQQWHRDVDHEVVEWLKERSKATVREFEEFLREIYSRPEMRERFPHGF